MNPPIRTTRRTLRSACAVVLVLLAGCSAADRNLAPGAAARPLAGSTIVILGLKQGFQVDFHKGMLEREVWRQNFWANAEVRSAPNKDGYLVLKMTPRTGTEIYGMSKIMVDDVGSPPRFYTPCGGATLTFEAPAGKVIYLGDLWFERNGDSLSPKLTTDENEVRAYLEKHYPSLAASLELQAARFRRARGVSCSSGIPLLIVI